MCLNISFSQLYLATEMEGWTWPGWGFSIFN
jgi:hypothetical protein